MGCQVSVTPAGHIALITLHPMDSAHRHLIYDLLSANARRGSQGLTRQPGLGVWHSGPRTRTSSKPTTRKSFSCRCSFFPLIVMLLWEHLRRDILDFRLSGLTPNCKLRLDASFRLHISIWEKKRGGYGPRDDAGGRLTAAGEELQGRMGSGEARRAQGIHSTSTCCCKGGRCESRRCARPLFSGGEDGLRGRAGKKYSPRLKLPT